MKTCGLSCLGLLGSASLLEGCAGTKYLDAELTGDFLKVPLNAFEISKKNKKKVQELYSSAKWKAAISHCAIQIF